MHKSVGVTVKFIFSFMFRYALLLYSVIFRKVQRMMS